MKKALSMILLAVFAMATAAYAVPSRAGKVDIGLNVSGAIPDESGIDSTVFVGGSLSYGVNEWLGLGISSGWAEFDETDLGITIEESYVPLFGDILFRIPMPDQQWQPYAVVGLGAVFTDFDVNVSNVDIDSDEEFAAKFGGGIDWFVNDNWIVNFEFSYIAADGNATIRNTVTGASVTAEGDNDTWMVGGGIKYLFS